VDAAIQLGGWLGFCTRTVTKSSFEGQDICQLEIVPAARHQLQWLKGKHFSEASALFVSSEKCVWRGGVCHPLKRKGGMLLRGGRLKKRNPLSLTS
jgi:hypothetical protein